MSELRCPGKKQGGDDMDASSNVYMTILYSYIFESEIKSIRQTVRCRNCKGSYHQQRDEQQGEKIENKKMMQR